MTRSKFEWLARAGYSARGIVFLLVAALAVFSSFGGGKADTKSALDAVLEQPFGRLWLGLIGLGLLGFVAWRLAQSIANADNHDHSVKSYLMIAWIGKDALLDRDSSPNLVGAVLQTEKRDGGFQVLFEITNDSSATASQVTVHGEIREQGAVIEDVETVLDYVPGHSKAKGGLIFQQDPTGKTLTVRASSFDEP
ncbi:DUF1206 domain-containing protein [Rhizobium laguerreae]|nr:DUF1206 domain-containing protein [Rhizobium laguerreae]